MAEFYEGMTGRCDDRVQSSRRWASAENGNEIKLEYPEDHKLIEDVAFCSYKAKRKSELTRHMLIHKDASELTTYDCNFCSYKTKRKSDLTGHMLTHKDISEVTTYQCAHCPYKAKHKSSLIQHLLIHKDISEEYR
ncbi:hypothetical protein NQ318_006908 [Aromia moschata]|uniref:C2H2-type domain-containing protein n=1 Tax=Aromia moschata TaxID=1265417 RepID=A0AAV8X8W9_9CUCU|nr:hypothetical protein NQ318_006908 [Aromia moschata]